MHTIEDHYPGVSYASANKRWRHRSKGKNRVTTWLPGEPFTPEFDAAYQAIVEGKPKPKPEPVKPATIDPTFADAWDALRDTDHWQLIDQNTRDGNTAMCNVFFRTRVQGDSTLTWKDCPVEGVTEEMVRNFLKLFAHKTGARAYLSFLRKLFRIAKQKGWIPFDPTLEIRVGHKKTPGHRAWPRLLREKFEAFYPIGTRPRTAYALAKCVGNRRSDVARIKWLNLQIEEVETDDEIEQYEALKFNQRKNHKRTGGASMSLRVMDELAAALAPLDRTTEFVLVNEAGKGYSDEGLGEMFQKWCKRAGIPDGYTLHGLRKALAKDLAELGATAIQIRDTLGHSTTREAEVYIAEADKRKTSSDALRLVSNHERQRFNKLRRVKLKTITGGKAQ